MTIQRQVQFWLLALAGFIITLWVLGPILMPFIAGLVLAYVLDPVADRLENMGLSRLAATLIILSIFLILFLAALIFLVPLTINQVSSFIDKLPYTMTRLEELAKQEHSGLFYRLIGSRWHDIQRQATEMLGSGATWAGTFMQSLWSGGETLMSIVSLLVVSPVVAFYMLLDFDHMVERVDEWVPPANRTTVRRLAREMNEAISGFMRGQAVVCVLLGLFYAAGLGLVGLNFGIVIGMVSGLLTFIPYVGSLVGLVLAVGVAMIQFWPDWFWIATVAVIFFTGQFIEGNILSPWLVGRSVGLHPVWLMFALGAFGYLLGFVGLLAAIPLAAAVGVLARFSLETYMNSALYRRNIEIEKPHF